MNEDAVHANARVAATEVLLAHRAARRGAPSVDGKRSRHLANRAHSPLTGPQRPAHAYLRVRSRLARCPDSADFIAVLASGPAAARPTSRDHAGEPDRQHERDGQDQADHGYERQRSDDEQQQPGQRQREERKREDSQAGEQGVGLEFSVIGDAVNVAARIESATRQTGDTVLVSEHTRALLSDQATGSLEERPPVPLKGKSQEVAIFAPADLARQAGRAQ